MAYANLSETNACRQVLRPVQQEIASFTISLRKLEFKTCVSFYLARIDLE
jgi:hypothetical protein